ncbi:uncharacterized protein VICG_01553 [Vittaforma corneae ATCC 50505]|uniref:Uncharacterized protein n=1 Tax=Vittaforma corneae (strain ATCC 50505) TaxID=993615 RepID=L2GKN7_VITCO|nr:uncharacterized protein VICG_01553 [Vittaforma corneae ATCC 50505]ELA41448.1 hypothetical protein VICG_01553 [Vittaforma corneae ATCC 50505]
MFRAVNTESESERKRILFERTRIQALYFSVAKTLNIDKFVELKVQFEQNQGLYSAGKANLLFSLVRKTPMEKLEELIEKYGVLESKPAFFEFIRKCIENEKFVKAKKLLNMARTKGWWCNDLFDLENTIECKYFKGGKIKKKPVFKNFMI